MRKVRMSCMAHSCLIDYHLIIENNLMILRNPLTKLLGWDVIFFYLTSCIYAGQPAHEMISYIIQKLLYGLYDNNKWQREKQITGSSTFQEEIKYQIYILRLTNCSTKYLNKVLSLQMIFLLVKLLLHN